MNNYSNNLKKLKDMKKLVFISLLMLGFASMGFMLYTPSGSPWVVPDKYMKMPNPVKSSPKSLKEGKELYSLKCQPCHGKKGLGDGPKAANLKTAPIDMTQSSFQSQPDGSLFYKISEGRGDMPKFKKEITDPDDIWNIINYVRTLK